MTMKEKCSKCKKLKQLITCDGCEKLFCNKHFDEHREELSKKMNNIDEEYQQFGEYLNKIDSIQSSLSHIDRWEHDSIAENARIDSIRSSRSHIDQSDHDSITKIQQAAENARNDLLKMFNRFKIQLRSSFDQVNHRVQLNKQSKTYTEINLDKLTRQLKQLRHLSTISFTDFIIYDNQSSIPLIQVIDTKQSFTLKSARYLGSERFDRKSNGITLYEDDRKAICEDRFWNGSNISGFKNYSTGVHSIRFRIVKKQSKNDFFFGITSYTKALNPWKQKTPFAYGWWNIPLENHELKMTDDSSTKEKLAKEDPTIKEGDEITLTIDCFNEDITFEHHRTKRYAHQTIDLDECPFPWQVAIVLYSLGDSVSIIS